MVSIMLIGAGSRADSDRPNLPTTLATSGTLSMARSCRAITCCTSVKEALGKSDGIARNEPSSRGGMNSRPMPGNVFPSRFQASEAVGSTPAARRPASSG